MEFKNDNVDSDENEDDNKDLSTLTKLKQGLFQLLT